MLKELSREIADHAIDALSPIAYQNTRFTHVGRYAHDITTVAESIFGITSERIVWLGRSRRDDSKSGETTAIVDELSSRDGFDRIRFRRDRHPKYRNKLLHFVFCNSKSNPIKPADDASIRIQESGLGLASVFSSGISTNDIKLHLPQVELKLGKKDAPIILSKTGPDGKTYHLVFMISMGKRDKTLHGRYAGCFKEKKLEYQLPKVKSA